MSAFLDCGDNSCRFAPKKGGMRTNGGCRCLSDLDHDPEQRMRVVKAVLALSSVADEAANWRDERELCEGKSTWHRLLDALREAGR